MAKRVRFRVVDVATGPEWAVLLLYDTDTRTWVVAWDCPTEACRREVTEDQGRPFAQDLFKVATGEVAELTNA